ncbi:reverse transcriptase/maturase family protein [Konateibacter massiliensis]|uniref:reverse transcriptase/maturase family protein n=1 Tax=Konateibacter massiliensis TaxID=2002841 RepID=UPI000C15A544|nr:reverse transcriptase/maturase family protein [Konateibacter massiliensis]
MTEDKTDFEVVTDFGNLYQAYKKSKSGKGFSKSSQQFQVATLDGIHQIKRRLETKTYEVSKYNEFTIYEPKERIIKAGSFVDKIVQHSLCDNVLIPKLESEFIQTNYAGQIGKGTLYGLDCLKAQMYLAYQKYGYNCWIVKADISKFFYNINRDILIDIVAYFIEDKDVFWLCKKFINSTEGLGLPLGNQVSQVFALLYLSGLDHFVTGELGVKYYGRYMDDFYLIVETKECAKWCLSNIYEFVHSLGLELNNKTQIIPFKNGIKFCGFHTYVTEDGRVIRKLKNENKRAAKKKFRKMANLVNKGKLSKDKFNESYCAWKNHISHGNCVKLGYEMDRDIEELFNKSCETNISIVD